MRRHLANADSDGRTAVVTYASVGTSITANVCNVYCKFCAFYRTETDADPYAARQKLDELTAAGSVQILLQGRNHPKLQFG